MKQIYQFLLVIAVISITHNANSAINKCVTAGKTIYTQESCPGNSEQKIDTRKSTVVPSTSGSISATFSNKLNWLQSASRTGPEITKFKEPYADINPTISSSVYSGPFSTPESYFKNILSHVKQRDKSMQVSGNVTEESIAGNKSYHLKINSTYVNAGKAYPVVAEFWAIPRGANVFVVVYSAGQNNAQENRSEAMEIINSLDFKN